MKRTILLLMLAGYLVIMCLPCHAGNEAGTAVTSPGTGRIAIPPAGLQGASEEVISSRKVPLKETARLREIWFARKKALASGDTKTAAELLEKLYQEKLNLGIKDLFIYSSALIREGEAADRAGRPKDGMSLVDRAISLSRDFPPAYFTAAWLSFGHLDVASAISYTAKGFSAMASNFFYTISILGNSLFLVLGALLISFAVYAAVLAIRYASAFSHDVGDIFPGEPPRIATLALGLLILFLPLLLEVGPLWLIAWCLILTFPYGNRVEKVVTSVFFLFLAASPLILNIGASFLASTVSGSVETLARARMGDWDQDLETSLKRYLADNPRDPDALLSLGLIAKKTGEFKKAQDYYEKALEPSSRNAAQARLHVNLGNALAGLGNADGAMKEYKKALDMDPSLASANYNLGQLSMKKGMIEGEEYLRKAKEIDPDLTGYYTEIYSSNLNRLLIDEELPLKALFGRFVLPNSQKDQLVNGLFLGLMKGVDVGIVPWLGGGGILIGLILTAILGKLGIARSCERCGRPSCRRCTGGAPDQLCPQCYSIYVRKEGVDPNMRIKKDAQIRKIEGRRIFFTRLFAIFFPGSGLMLRGETIQGMVVLFLLALVVLKMIFWEGFIRDKYPVTASFPIAQIASLGVALLSVYLIGLLAYLRKE